MINGRLPSALPRVALDHYMAAFEAGSPEGPESIGEFIALNGIAYARSTRPGVQRGKLLVGKDVISNGAVFLPERQEPYAVVELGEPTSLTSLYARLTTNASSPICFVGTAVFEQLDATAIGKAPIYDENIFANDSAYYPDPPVHRSNVPAALMGCAAYLDKLDPGERAALRAVLYENPNEPAHAITAHTHLLEMKVAVNTLARVTPDLAVNVHHAFGSSILRTGRFEVFRIASVRSLAG